MNVMTKAQLDLAELPNNCDCSKCGASANLVTIPEYHFTASGLDNVYLHDVKAYRCPNCGNGDVMLFATEKILQTIAKGLIEKRSELTGKEIRFLRKRMQMTAEELGSIMGVDKATISRWENGVQDMGKQSDRLLRTLAMIYTQGQEYLRGLANEFKHIKPNHDAPQMDIDYNGESEQYKYQYS
jgi:putative zinc finger/helix-turn-helix YgiT family protein